VIAKFIVPGENEPTDFVLTRDFGHLGAFVATYLRQVLGWYSPGQGARLIGAVVGAIIVVRLWPDRRWKSPSYLKGIKLRREPAKQK
jgi:uncharacterized membrane protein YeaQ/YmgE (transglycosylase-associated protein family)